MSNDIKHNKYIAMQGWPRRFIHVSFTRVKMAKHLRKNWGKPGKIGKTSRSFTHSM